jgi:hypothetical protein
MTRGVWPNERPDTAGCRKGPDRIEATEDPLPLLAVMKKGADGHDVAGRRARRQGAPHATAERIPALDIVPNTHPFLLREVGRTEPAGPVRGFADLGMLLGQPPATLKRK